MDNITNQSKAITKTDDSAAELLMDILGNDQGRNFDIESIFAERKTDGSWKWIIYEFLKADSIPPQISHPNYYWNKNKRKFLSLWAIVQVFRKAGFECELILLNYADDRTLGIKEMIVQSIDIETKEVFRKELKNADGEIIKKELKNHINVVANCMKFDEWKAKFKDFNKNKKGDTWEILEELKSLSESSTILISSPKGKYTNMPINQVECDDLITLAVSTKSEYQDESRKELIRRCKRSSEYTANSKK